MSSIFAKSFCSIHLHDEETRKLICSSKNVKKTDSKKSILGIGSASLLKNSLWDNFQFLLVQINLLVSP